MARAITKSGFESIIYAFVVANMEDTHTATIKVDAETEIEIEYTNVFVERGNKSDNAAQLACEKRFGKNSMVVYVEKRQASKLSLTADAFIKNSRICEEGKSYGHDFVTAEFKVTYMNVMYRDKKGMHTATLIYNGETTDSKLLNFARAATDSKMCVVKSKAVKKERRYMSRARYEMLATEFADNGETETDGETDES